MHAEKAQREVGTDLDGAIEDTALDGAGLAADEDGGAGFVADGAEGKAAEQCQMALLIGAVDPRAVREVEAVFLEPALEVGEIGARTDFGETEDIGRNGREGGDDGGDGLGGFRRGGLTVDGILGRLERVVTDIPCGKNKFAGVPGRRGDRRQSEPKDGREDGARREHGGSGRFVRLLVGSFFHVERGGGFFHFAVEFLAGFAEFVDALAETFGQFGQAFGAEENENDEENEQDLRPSGSGEGEQRCHRSTLRPPAAGRNRECARYLW